MSLHSDTADAARLDARIIELKDSGLSFREIASHPDVNRTLSYVHRCYRRGIQRIAAPAVEQYRERQLAEIAAERALLDDIVAHTHKLVSNGHIISDIVGRGDDGKPIYGEALPDFTAVLAALDRRAKLRSQEQDLLPGLKAPTKVDATVTETTQADVELAAMIREQQARNAVVEAQLRESTWSG